MPRRRRRRISWGPLLWGAVAANTAAGLWLSPSTAVRKVRVTGAPFAAKHEIEARLRGIESVPAARIEVRELESELQTIEMVEAAEFSRNIFGSARLAIRARRAVARLEGQPELYLDRAGGLFALPTEGRGLPVIALPADSAAGSLAVCATWPARTIAKLCEAVAEFEPFRGGKVEIEASGSVSLWAETGARVELGGPERMDEKLAELSKLLSSRPGLMEEVVSLNLASPSRPMIVPKRGDDNQ